MKRIGWTKAIAALLLSAAMTTVAAAQIKVGVIVSGTGPGAALGQPQLKSIPVLPTEIGGQKVVYIQLDDESDATKAALATRKLIQEEKVDIIIGSSLTPNTLAMIPVAAEAQTPIITLSASGAVVFPLDDKKRWVYKIVPNDVIMANVIARYMAKQGVKRLGYIGFSDAYGEGYYNDLSKVAPGLGIQLTTHEVYARNDNSVTGQVLKVLATNPDAVFIAAAGTPAVLPHKALRERGYKGPIYHTHGISTPEFIRLGGADVEGSIFAGEAFTIAEDLPENSPFRSPTLTYINSYRKQHNQDPNLFGAHIYDALSLLAVAGPNALKKAKPGTVEFRIALRDELEKIKDLPLNNGLFNFSPTDHGGHDERSAFLIKIEGGKFRAVK